MIDTFTFASSVIIIGGVGFIGGYVVSGLILIKQIRKKYPDAKL